MAHVICICFYASGTHVPAHVESLSEFIPDLFSFPFFPLQRVIFNVVNFSKTKSLYRDGMAPMVKSTSRPKW